jgi:hypothetical protein
LGPERSQRGAPESPVFCGAKNAPKLCFAWRSALLTKEAFSGYISGMEQKYLNSGSNCLEAAIAQTPLDKIAGFIQSHAYGSSENGRFR